MGGGVIPPLITSLASSLGYMSFTAVDLLHMQWFSSLFNSGMGDCLHTRAHMHAPGVGGLCEGRMFA